MNTVAAVFQSKHLISKRLVWKFFMWSIIFCIFKIDEDIAKLVQIIIYFIIQNCLNILYRRQFLRYKRPLYEKLVRNQRRLSSCLSIPMFIGTPCVRYMYSSELTLI